MEGSPPATIRAVSSAQWSLVVTTTKAEEFELGLVTSRQCFSLQSIFLIYRNFPEQLPTTFSCSPILADTLEPLREALKTLMKSTVTRIQYIKGLPRGAAAKVRCRTRWRHRPAVNGGAGRATTLRSPRRRSGDLPFLHGYKKPEGQTNFCAHSYLALQLQESCFTTPFEHGPRLRGGVLQNAHGTPTY